MTFSRVSVHKLGLALGREDGKRVHQVEDVFNLFKKPRLTKAQCPSRVVNGYGELNGVQQNAKIPRFRMESVDLLSRGKRIERR